MKVRKLLEHTVVMIFQNILAIVKKLLQKEFKKFMKYIIWNNIIIDLALCGKL